MNDYNYIRVSRLEPVSIEALALVVAAAYFFYLVSKKQASWDVVYLLALPFTDDPFRIGSLQPVEVVSLAFLAFNFRKIRLNYLILIGFTFCLFSFIGIVTGNVQSLYSPLYSLRFLLIGLVFSAFRNSAFQVPVPVLRFLVGFAFGVTALQASLWLVGLPIHGVFYNGVLPRTKGLAHEPATWAIFVVTLFPFILHFKLGRLYLVLNFLMLLLTFSTFGTVATLVFFALRWLLAGAHFRLRPSALRAAAVTVALLLVVAAVKPEAAASAGKLFSVFDKLLLYQQELTLFSQGRSVQEAEESVGAAESGRGSDFNFFKETFPSHWLTGIGSFNAPYDVNGPNPIAGTNTYLMLPVETGAAGFGLIVILLIFHYRGLLHDRHRRSIDLMAYSLTFLLMISGIRCFGFYEPWYAQSALLRLAPPEVGEAEAAEHRSELLAAGTPAET